MTFEDKYRRSVFLILLQLIFDGEHHNLIENLFMKGGSLKEMLRQHLAPASVVSLNSGLFFTGTTPCPLWCPLRRLYGDAVTYLLVAGKLGGDSVTHHQVARSTASPKGNIFTAPAQPLLHYGKLSVYK